MPTLIAALAEGLQVPHDLSLITFGDGSLNDTGQNLTILSTGFRALGHEAVTMLRAQLISRGPVPTRAVPGICSAQRIRWRHSWRAEWRAEWRADAVQ